MLGIHEGHSQCCHTHLGTEWISHFCTVTAHRIFFTSGARLNIKISSYQHRNSHYKDETISQSDNLTHNCPSFGTLQDLAARRLTVLRIKALEAAMWQPNKHTWYYRNWYVKTTFWRTKYAVWHAMYGIVSYGCDILLSEEDLLRVLSAYTCKVKWSTTSVIPLWCKHIRGDHFTSFTGTLRTDNSLPSGLLHLSNTRTTFSD